MLSIMLYLSQRHFLRKIVTRKDKYDISTNNNFIYFCITRFIFYSKYETIYYFDLIGVLFSRNNWF